MELKERSIKLKVNGEVYEICVKPYETLVEVLRDKLNLTGTKFACGTGECGACTVLVDNKPVLSCLTLAVAVEGKEIVTVEGLIKDGSLHPVHESFIEHGAFQCGFCTPGMVIMAVALLNENPKPTEEEIKDYIKGNICRCTGYVSIIKAILACAKKGGG